MAKSIKAAICILLLAVLGLCVFRLIRGYSESAAQAEVYEQLADSFAAYTEESSKAVIQNNAKAEKSIFDKRDDLYGWISIPDTRINYPVMQAPDNDPDYYLAHDVNGSESRYGCPFVQADCNLESDCTIIYGHHIKDGSMFADLDKFTKKSFWEEHKSLTFETLDGRKEYRIVCVFKTALYADDSFRYYDYVDFTDKEEFDQFWKRCRELSLYDTGLAPEYEDRLIMLSTCEYSRRDGRLVVVAVGS